MGSIVGVTLSENYPIGMQHVALDRKLNLLYGKNGTGKTKILEAVSKVLHGAVEQGSYRSTCAQSLFFNSSSIHWQHRFKSAVSEDQSQTKFWEEAHFEKQLSKFLLTEPWNTRKDSVHRRFFHGNYTEEQWKWLFKEGRWLLKPEGILLLCDPDPFNSPLHSEWKRSQEWWAEAIGEIHRESFEELELSLLNKDGYCIAEIIDWLMEDCSDEGGPPSWLLTPLPTLLNLPEPPAWVAYPVFRMDLDAIWMPWNLPIWQPSLGREPTEVVAQLRSDLKRLMLGACENPDFGDFDEGKPDELVIVEICADFERRVNFLLGQLFEDPPRISIVLGADQRFQIFRNESLRVVAKLDLSDVEVPLDKLGDSHRRYAISALYLVMAEMFAESDLFLDLQPTALEKNRPFRNLFEEADTESDLVTKRDNTVGVVSDPLSVIDEPERGLHARAEEFLAQGVSNLEMKFFVATHSLRFLEVGLSEGRAHLVERLSNGSFRVNSDFPKLSSENTKELEQQLGIGAAQVISLISGFLFVEGLHDKVVIEGFLRNELRTRRFEIIAMHGTKGVTDLILSQFLFAATAAPIIICLDNGDQRRLEEIIAVVRSEETVSSRLNSLDRFGKTFKTPEMNVIREVIRQAIKRDRLDRIIPFMFSKKDIIEYLPVEQLSRGRYASWESVRKDFLSSEGKTHFSAGDGRRYKDWMIRKGIDCTERAIRQEMEMISPPDTGGPHHRPSDFMRLAELLEGLR